MDTIEGYKETEEFMAKLAKFIDARIVENIGEKGFALLIFEFGEPGVSNYVSNASREGMIEALRETARRLEEKQDLPVSNYTIQ